MSYIFKECEATGKTGEKVVELFDCFKNHDKDIRDFLESRNCWEYIDYKLFKVDAIHYLPEIWEFSDLSEVEKDIDIYKIGMVIEITIREGDRYDLFVLYGQTQENFMKKLHPSERTMNYITDESICFGIVPKSEGEITLNLGGFCHLLDGRSGLIENIDRFFDELLRFYLNELLEHVYLTDEQRKLMNDFIKREREEEKKKAGEKGK